MKKVALHNLGCKVNSYEIEVMQEKMEERGYTIVPFAPGADIYIINTCTVTNIADRKSRQMLHKAKKMNPEAVVVAVGCYVQTGKETVEKDPCIDLAIGNNKKKDIVSILEEYLEQRKLGKEDKTLHETTIYDINDGVKEYEEMTLTRTGEHTRAYVKIQDGCNQFCSYCIIPFARGRVRSRKEEDILREVGGLVEAGYQEIVITGIHLSSYGRDFVTKGHGDYMEVSDPGLKAYKKGYLIDIIEKIAAIEGLKRLRIGSLEPRIITKEFAERLKQLDNLCPHFHLSLQSGCDETLKRMNRFYDSTEYRNKVKLLREVFDNPAITTDVIVGFPGETEEEFEITYEFLKEIKFYEMHVFKYSKREGTVAAARKDQIPEAIKAKRSDILLKLAGKQSEEYRKTFLNKELTVLIEEEKEIQGVKYQVGFTPSYIRVAVRSDEDLCNQIVTVTPVEIYGEFLRV